jgi:hypothetical protein
MHDLISPDGYGKVDISIMMDEFSGLLKVGIGGVIVPKIVLANCTS